MANDLKQAMNAMDTDLQEQPQIFQKLFILTKRIAMRWWQLITCLVLFLSNISVIWDLYDEHWVQTVMNVFQDSFIECYVYMHRAPPCRIGMILFFHPSSVCTDGIAAPHLRGSRMTFPWKCSYMYYTTCLQWRLQDIIYCNKWQVSITDTYLVRAN